MNTTLFGPTISFAGPNAIEATAWHAHPLYTNNAFFLHDVGIILLSKAVRLPSSQYGTLPSLNQLDARQERPDPSGTGAANLAGKPLRLYPMLVQRGAGWW